MTRKTNIPTKRREIREDRLRRQKSQRMLTVIVIAGVSLLLAGLLIVPSIVRSQAPAGEIVPISVEDATRPNPNFNAMGDPNAPVRMENFSDFQCPYCKRFADETEKLIVENYVVTGKVYFIFTPYGPGGNYIGQESLDAANASFCAADQGMFWEYHDILFANNTGENVGDFTEKRLEAFAKSIGLDMNKFQDCFKASQFNDKLNEGIVAGRNAGINVTPSFLINGKIIEGAQPNEVFIQEIEAALASAAAQP